MANIKVKFKEAYQDFGAYALLKNVTDKGVLIVDGTEVLNSIADLPTTNTVDGQEKAVIVQNGQVVTTSINITPRVQSITSSATVTPTSTNDLVTITAQAVDLTLANPTGTFAEGQALMIRIKDNGTAQAITFGSNYRAIGVTLPTTTIANKILYLGIIYDSIDAKWNILGTPQQA